jgi:DNA-directed RNA polymerase specialized sigma24 family protein
MKDQDCGYYLLTSTANEIWKQGDEAGLGKMLACVAAVHKESFFRRVIYKSRLVEPVMLRELGENVFLQTWEVFIRRGREGSLRLEAKEYAGYLFVAFKGNYLKALERELNRVAAEREFGEAEDVAGSAGAPAFADGLVVRPANEPGEWGESAWRERTRRALGRISSDCRQLLIWRHVEGLSHDEIAQRKHINRSSSIKMVSRCGRRFAEIWRELGR